MARNGKENALVLALASGASVDEAATAAGISRRTAYRRLQDATVQRQIVAARDEIYESSVSKLAVVAQQATERLRDLIQSSNERVSLPAVRIALELVPRWRESVELTRRVQQLEDLFHELAPPPFES